MESANPRESDPHFSQFVPLSLTPLSFPRRPRRAVRGVVMVFPSWRVVPPCCYESSDALNFRYLYLMRVPCAFLERAFNIKVNFVPNFNWVEDTTTLWTVKKLCYRWESNPGCSTWPGSNPTSHKQRRNSLSIHRVWSLLNLWFLMFPF